MTFVEMLKFWFAKAAVGGVIVLAVLIAAVPYVAWMGWRDTRKGGSR